MKRISLLTVIALIIVQGCSYFKESSHEKPLARAFEQYLYPSDLQKVIPSGTSQEDSAQMANRYIESWVQEQLMQLAALSGQ